MKNIAVKILILSIVAVAASGCNSDLKYKDYNVEGVTGLLTPVNSYFVELEPGDNKFVTFEWEAAKTESGLLPQYEVVFFSTPGGAELFRYDAGMMTSTQISHKNMNKIADLAGIDAESEGGNLYWGVVANLGIKEATSEETYMLAVKRLAGFSNIPDMLYLVGSATECEELGLEMMPMKSIGDDEGEFEIYTKLDAGGTYNFMGDDGTYYSYANGLMTESNTPLEVASSGIYRIKLDMTTKSIAWKQINEVRYHFPHNTDFNVVVPYIGNGQWQLSNFLIRFADASWGIEERFRFNVAVSGESYDSEIWGSETLNNDQRPLVLTGNFWDISIRPNVNIGSYDYTFKYTLECDNRNSDITIDMSPTSDVYHLYIDLK